MSSQQATSGTTCRGCGSHVTPQYARVLGDQHDDVHECPDCPDSDLGRRINGAAAGLDLTERNTTIGDQ